MFRQTLTHTDRSPRLRGGGLAGDFRNGCWESTCVPGCHPPAQEAGLGWVVEAAFTWPFREPNMMSGSRKTPGEWRTFHQESLCDHLLLACHQAGQTLRNSRTVGCRRNWHEHLGALIHT